MAESPKVLERRITCFCGSAISRTVASAVSISRMAVRIWRANSCPYSESVTVRLVRSNSGAPSSSSSALMLRLSAGCEMPSCSAVC